MLKTFFLSATVLASCPTAWASIVEDFSGRLEEDMTIEQVQRVLGYRPNHVENKTCGTKTDSPWNCRTHSYTDVVHILTVLFRRNGQGVWVVNSWFVN